MRLALLSDSHNSWSGLQEAVTSEAAEACGVALFAGDLTRPKGVGVLTEFPGPVHMVVGNMDHDIDGIWAQAEESDNVIFHGEICDIERSGVRIFMNHYPEEAAKRGRTDTYDLCVYGHTHQFRDESVGGTRIINPGALTSRGSQPHWSVFEHETGQVHAYEV